MQSLAQARLKRLHALRLASEGLSYDEIAKAVGFSNRGSAHRAVFKALDEREVEGAEQLRQLEGARLDALQASLWDAAVSGDHKSAGLVLRIIDTRIRLFGLAPKGSAGSDNAVGPYDVLVIGPREGNPGEATSATSSST